MKKLPGFSTLLLALALAGCGSKDGGANSAAPAAKPVAAVPAPAGTSWVDSVAETPGGGFVMGNPNAPIKLIEYASYTCPHCRDFTKESAESMKKDFVATGKVSYELRNYIRDPLDLTMVLLARCGGKDPFFPLSEQIFANQEDVFKKAQGMGDAAYKAVMSLPPQQRFVSLAQATGLIDFAKQRGISEGQAKQCLADTRQAEKVTGYVEAANKQYTIEGTPTFIINGVVVKNVATWPPLREKLHEAGA